MVRLDSVTIVDKALVREELSVASGRRSIAQLQAGKSYPVEFEKKGGGTLYYGLKVNFFPKGNAAGSDEGLAVLKSVGLVDTTLPASGTYPAGSVLQVQLTVVTNRSRTFVVIDDPLPAGFETINDKFKTSASWDRSIAEDENNFWQWWRQFPFNNAELRDDRVVIFADDLPLGSYTFTYYVRATSPGFFSMPATRAECMYEPEVFGQSSSTSVRIK